MVLQGGSLAPPTERVDSFSELFQWRASGGFAPLKLPEAISVAFTPMALPVGVPGFEVGSGSVRGETVGTIDNILK